MKTPVLTDRDNLLLYLIEQNLGYKEIAHRFKVKPQTIKNWVVLLRTKLGVEDRTIKTAAIRRKIPRLAVPAPPPAAGIHRCALCGIDHPACDFCPDEGVHPL